MSCIHIEWRNSILFLQQRDLNIKSFLLAFSFLLLKYQHIFFLDDGDRSEALTVKYLIQNYFIKLFFNSWWKSPIYHGLFILISVLGSFVKHLWSWKTVFFPSERRRHWFWDIRAGAQEAHPWAKGPLCSLCSALASWCLSSDIVNVLPSRPVFS